MREGQTHLVLLPGMDGTGQLFHRFASALPEGVKVTIVQYPTDKELDWEDLANLVARQLPPEDSFALIAESFSGPIGILLASRMPPNLVGLVLCTSFCTTPLPWGTRWFWRLVRPRMFQKPLPTPMIRRNFVGSNPPEGLIQEVQDAIGSVSPSVLAQRLRLISRVDVRAALAMVQVPVLYLEAQADRLVGRRGAAQIRSILPETRFLTLDGPHLLLQRRPEECAVAILVFLVQGSPGNGQAIPHG